MPFVNAAAKLGKSFLSEKCLVQKMVQKNGFDTSSNPFAKYSRLTINAVGNQSGFMRKPT